MSSRLKTFDDGRRRARRAGLLVALVGSVALAVALGPAWAWPLVALPMMVALPLAGQGGFAFASLASAGVLGVAASQPGRSSVELIVGWVVFAIAAALVGGRYDKVQRDLTRVVGASLRDRLTGLYNFAYFSDTLRRETERARRYGSPLTLVLFDLDGFKSFNDTHGHEAGNRLLAEVGKVIEAQRRSADVAARFGGEEFALLVTGDAQAAWEAAERIRMMIARVTVPVGKGQHDSRTISAGIASYSDGQPPDSLVEEADRALYSSKRRGRNRVTFAGGPELDRAAS